VKYEEGEKTQALENVKQAVLSGYTVYANGNKVEDSSKIDYEHVHYTVDDERKEILVTIP
jgi:hypothetical protein